MRIAPFQKPRTGARALFLSVLTSALVMVGVTPAYAAADTEPPTAPGAITVVEATTTSVKLTWGASTDNVGVVQYHVSRKHEDLIYGHSSATNSLLVENLQASQTYEFTVSAVDAAGNRSGSSPALRVTLPPGDSQPPTAPGQPVASEVTKTSVRLTWTYSTDNIKLNRYEILRLTGSGSTVIGDVSQHPPGKNWFWATGLSPDTSYTFAVRAVDDAGNVSAPSAPVTVTTLAESADTTPPSEPGEIRVVESTETSVLLTWDAATDNVGVVGYHVLRRYEDLVYGHSSATNSLLVENLQASQTYEFTVSAVDAAGNRSGSSPALRVTLPPGDSQPPTVPGQPVATAVYAIGVALTWSHSTDNIKLNRYEILRLTGSGSTVVGNVSQHPPGKNFFTVTDLSPDTSYTFAVRAVDDAGNVSAPSAPVTVTTLSVPSCAASYTQTPRPGVTTTNLTIRNTSRMAVDGWTASWTVPASQRLHGLSGAELVSRDGDTVTVRNTRRNATIPANGTVRISYRASAATAPADVVLNGVPCRAG